MTRLRLFTRPRAELRCALEGSNHPWASNDGDSAHCDFITRYSRAKIDREGRGGGTGAVGRGGVKSEPVSAVS